MKNFDANIVQFLFAYHKKSRFSLKNNSKFGVFQNKLLFPEIVEFHQSCHIGGMSGDGLQCTHAEAVMLNSLTFTQFRHR